MASLENTMRIKTTTLLVLLLSAVTFVISCQSSVDAERYYLQRVDGLVSEIEDLMANKEGTWSVNNHFDASPYEEIISALDNIDYVSNPYSKVVPLI